MKTRLALPALVVLSLATAACAAGGSGSPNPTPGPTPTPITVDVTTPQEAAAVVIASDPLFEGAIELTPDIIGASKWWEAEAIDDGYRVTLVVGWGDCPAGCINKHTWVHDVSSDGQLTLVEESGDEIPPGGVPAGDI
ncbi:MAG TPA: hypothetical protein VFX65_15020 [Candidatus Limnocylindrales bacterium]|nr:hypothetical protein [Candidatus Limnocylindrales bacterium]